MENGRGKNGCGPKIEPVEPASESFLSHLLYNHVILKTQPGYTLKKRSLAAFAGTLGPQYCNQRLSSQWLQGESANWPSHSRNDSRLNNAVIIQGSFPCLGIG